MNSRINIIKDHLILYRQTAVDEIIIVSKANKCLLQKLFMQLIMEFILVQADNGLDGEIESLCKLYRKQFNISNANKI